MSSDNIYQHNSSSATATATTLPPGQQLNNGRLTVGCHRQQQSLPVSASQLYPCEAREVRPVPPRLSSSSSSSQSPSQPTRRHSTAATVDAGLLHPISGAKWMPTSSDASVTGVRLHQRGQPHRPQPGRRYRSRAQTAAILFNTSDNSTNDNSTKSHSDGWTSRNNNVVVVDMSKGRQLLDGSTNSIASSNKTLALSRTLLPPLPPPKLATIANQQYRSAAETNSRSAPAEVRVDVEEEEELSSAYNASQRELGTRSGSSSSSSSSLGNSSYYSPAISHGQYSSSQAHLQSLTSQPNLNLDNSICANNSGSSSSSSLLLSSSMSPESIGAIKSPTPTGYWPASSAANGCRLHNWRTQTMATGSNNMRPSTRAANFQQPQRMPTVATAAPPSPPPLVDNATKPMSTSNTPQAQQPVQLIEPSRPSASSSSSGGWRRLNNNFNFNFNLAPGHTRTSRLTGQLASDCQHPLPPPYSPVDEHGQQQALSSSSGQLATDQAASSSTSAPTPTPTPAPALVNPISSGANNCAHQHHQQQLQIQHNRQQYSQQQQSQQHQSSPQPQPATVATTSGTLPEAPLPASGSPNDGVGGSQVNFAKSKSCLACADISIKWYIVVIALLGLMCALIGTIVGAVHSAGRDYISLSLLLLGVGLVLIAISWISLRITINTYKTSTNLGANTNQPWTSSSSRISTLGMRPGSIGQHNRQHHLHLNERTTMTGQPGRARPLSNHNQSQLLATSLANQAMLNERLYMMAAMAAAAAAASGSNSVPQGNGQCGRTTSGARRPRPDSSSSEQGQIQGLIGSIKRRLPHCLSRFLSSRGDGATTNEDNQVSATANRRSQEQPGQASDGAWPGGRQSQLQARASIPLQPNATNPATGTLASLLHQYHMLQQPHPILPFLAPHHHPMQPPPMPPPSINLFAAGLANYLHDPLFRPPPPSYNAAMQEQRIRMIMQERASLQQLQQQQQWASSSTPRVSPSAAPVAISGSESATAALNDAAGPSIGTRSEELATTGRNKLDSCHCVGPTDRPYSGDQEAMLTAVSESSGQALNDNCVLDVAAGNQN